MPILVKSYILTVNLFSTVLAYKISLIVIADKVKVLPFYMTVTSHAKSYNGDYTRRSINEYQIKYGMPADLSFIYAASPPLQSVLTDQSRLRQCENIPPRSCRITYQNISSMDKPGLQLYNESFRHPFSGGILKSRRDTGLPAYVLSHGSSIKQNNCRSPESDVEYLDFVTKSCLRLSKEAQSMQTDSKAKKVTFADAHGLALTMVKYMTEATREPPKWDDLGSMMKTLRLTVSPEVHDSSAESEKPVLTADFKQPAADYIKFKELVETNNVCLENVIVKGLTSISGTLKVKNLGFEKKVSIRITFDDWKTFSDCDASHVKNFCDQDIYDTFQFNIAVPTSFDPIRHKAEFCICYEVNGCQFWDNNLGKNYVVKTSVFSKHCAQQPQHVWSRFSMPNTYCELPSPQFNTWSDWENKGPFY